MLRSIIATGDKVSDLRRKSLANVCTLVIRLYRARNWAFSVAYYAKRRNKGFMCFCAHETLQCFQFTFPHLLV
jgi:hypothetical protein